MVSREVLILEKYYEQVEGMARYVEGKAYEELYSKEVFTERYLKNLESFQKGSAKYYSIGMAKCLLLDRLDANWKQNYDFSKSLTDCLYKQIEEQGSNVSADWRIK